MIKTLKDLMNINEGSNVLLSFSGGADSTALLKHLLLKGCRVTTFYMSSVQHPIKANVEIARRKEILEYFHSTENGKFLGGDVTIDQTTKVDQQVLLGISATGFAQPICWLHGALVAVRTANMEKAGRDGPKYVAEEVNSFDHVAIGYLADDQMSAPFNNLSIAWDLLFDITVKSHKKTTLVAPLLFHNKQDVYTFLTPEEIELTWSCELPIYNPKARFYKYRECGECKPCRTKKSALNALKRKQKEITNVKDN